MEVIAWIVGVPVGLVLLLCIPWLSEMMTRGTGGGTSGVANALSEAFDPAAHRSASIISEAKERKQSDEAGDDEDPDAPKAVA